MVSNPGNSERLERNKVYPIAGDSMALMAAQAQTGRRPSELGAVWTGERRYPRKDEWYLSGAIIEAYNAPNNLTGGPDAICRLVDKRTAEPIRLLIPDFPRAGVHLLDDGERAILDMAAALDSWCRYKREDAQSPFGSEQVTKRLYRAFEQALGHETGRLDPRTLMAWADRLMRALEIDTD